MHHLHVCVEFAYVWPNNSRMKDLALWLYQRMILRDWYNSSLQANWLTWFNSHSNTPLQRAESFALLCWYIYMLVLLLLLLLAVHPWLLGIHHLYTYMLLKKVSTPLIDVSLDAGYMFISILLLLRWYSPLEVQLWWQGRYSIFDHWRPIVLCWLNSHC